GEPVIRREGKDVTLIALGPALYTAMKAAEQLAEKGLEAEVIDLRWINPLKYELLIESVKKTGRAVFVTDSAERGSYLHTVSSNLSRLAFDYLDAPTIVVGSKNWITPPAEMEEYYFAQAYSVLDAIHEQILPIRDYVPKSNYTDGEFFRTSRLGV
ncbi:MAG: transketolase C-terminal domain-containing protein, partial [Sphaerochaetaceae bacterium]